MYVCMKPPIRTIHRETLNLDPGSSIHVRSQSAHHLHFSRAQPQIWLHFRSDAEVVKYMYHSNTRHKLTSSLATDTLPATAQPVLHRVVESPKHNPRVPANIARDSTLSAHVQIRPSPPLPTTSTRATTTSQFSWPVDQTLHCHRPQHPIYSHNPPSAYPLLGVTGDPKSIHQFG